MACCNYQAEHIFKMEPLSSDLSKKLFLDVVLGSGKECPEQFNNVLDEITGKCGGLPLALISVANIVSSQPETLKHWELVKYFLRNNLGTNPTPEEILKAVLEHCYSSLPHYLKTCLMYLSVYPENYMILKDDLVKQWAAEGFVSAKEGKDVVEVGGNYFDELVNLGLIQHMDLDYNDEMLYVVPHMVLDLITRKSIEDNFVIVINYSQTKVRLSEKVRRLSLHFGSATNATTPTSINLSQVRSLSFVGLFNRMPSIKDFKFLRVAILHTLGDNRSRCFNLTAICALFQLIYLQIRCNVDVKLPHKMDHLTQLETLEINAAVPSDVMRIPSLLYLQPEREKKLHTVNGNTKYLTLGPTASSTVSAYSPPVFLQRLELLPIPRLPQWIQQPQKLSCLKIMVGELHRSDIGVLAGLPALTVLCVYIRQPTAESFIIERGTFPVLKYFEFMCDVILFLEFQEEAMPNLRRLKVGFNAHKGQKYGNMLAGIQHLLNLKEIARKIGAATDADESDKRAAEYAFHCAISKHPCCRNFDVRRMDQVDEDYSPSEIQEWDQDKDSSSEQQWTPKKQPEELENESKDSG